MANLTASGFVFSRSLKKVSMAFPSAGVLDPKGGRLSLSLGDAPEFEGRFFPPVSLDVSEWADAAAAPFPDFEPTGEPILRADDVETIGLYGRTMVITAEYGGNVATAEAVVIPGGLSSDAFTRFSEAGKDIFTERFLNPANNFFLTTRTAGWRIVIKETELYPLYFIFDRPRILQVRELATGASQMFRLGSDIFALDLAALRRYFVIVDRVFPSMFDVYVDSNFSCRIVIEKARQVKNRYRLKYRSSFGVPEIVELTGDLTFSPSFESSDDFSYSAPSAFDGKLKNYRMRQPMSLKGSISTGPKRADEIRMILDAVASPEAWLLDYAAHPVRVLLSLESTEIAARPEAPQELKLGFELQNEETNISPDISDPAAGRKPRVFSKQFNKVFN